MKDRQKHIQRSAKVFVFTFVLVISAKSARVAVDRWQQKNTIPSSISIVSAAKFALFPTLLPELYSYSKQFSPDTPFLSELISSPALLLLPPSWRVQVVLQIATEALLHMGEGSRWRKKLPPTWTLNVIGNVWLLWAFLFKSQAFPKAYEKVILSHSTHYVPKGMSRSELDKILCKSSPDNAEADVSKSSAYKHQFRQCSQLHPNQPSCIVNFVDGFVHEFVRVGKWMGAFFAIVVALQNRREIIKGNVRNALRSWIDATIRGSAFVSGSINTSWAVMCVLQRILPGDILPRARYIINASLASLWILILPDKRRAGISLYVARLAALCAWEAWKLEGGWTIPYGECILLALSWGQVARLRKQGARVSGSFGYILKLLDKDGHA